MLLLFFQLQAFYLRIVFFTVTFLTSALFPLCFSNIYLSIKKALLKTA